MEEFGIQMEKYFKFNSSHFVVYNNFRENLHGHNYKVSIKIKGEKLTDSFYIIDFDEVKKILTKICENLKHVLLLPKQNQYIKIKSIDDNKQIEVTCQDDTRFVFPVNDVRIIDVPQISAECLSKFILHEFKTELFEQHKTIQTDIKLKKMTVKVYEDKGKCGIYSLKF